MQRIQSIRGAIDVTENSIDAISSATTKLIKEILEKNSIKEDDIVNIMFTITDDLDAINPATVIRKTLNLTTAPMLCSQEMKIQGAMPKVIRTLVQTYTSLNKNQIKHIYLEKAESLRPDLAG